MATPLESMLTFDYKINISASVCFFLRVFKDEIWESERPYWP